MDGLGVQLAQLQSAQLVMLAAEEELAYLFRHALIQETAYDSLLVKRRREIHRRVAEAYERVYADSLDPVAALLAQHYRAAGDDAKLVEYATRAGDHAARLSADPEAGAHYALALEALLRLADIRENRRARIDTQIKLTSVSFAFEDPEQNLARLREAEALAEDLLRGDPNSLADRLRLARVEAWRARMHFFRQERRAALDDFRRVLPVAQELGDEELAALASAMIARISLWSGEFSQALPLLQQTMALVEQRENWTEWILSCAQLGIGRAALGDYRSGVAEAEKAIARAKELHHQHGLAGACTMLSIVYLIGGATRPMLEASHASVEIGVASGNAISIVMASALQAWAESRLGEHQAARDSMVRAEGLAQKLGGQMFFDDWVAAIRVEMTLNAGQIQETLARAEQAVAFARSLDGKFAEGLVQRTWGQALCALNPPQWQEAEVHFATSLELFEPGGAVLEAARTHAVWGQALQACGDAEAAREHLVRAAAQFKASELTDEFERAQRVIDSTA